MQNAITTLRIQNFKSIKDVTMQPRRVNIIIGEPNVGKSNILEALSLLGGMFFDQADGRFMDGQIRYETVRNLFYDNDWSQEITVTGEGVGATRLRKREEIVDAAFGKGEFMKTGGKDPFSSLAHAQNALSLAFKQQDHNALVNFQDKNEWLVELGKDGRASNKKQSNPKPPVGVKKYAFQKQSLHNRAYNSASLRPPYGDNLLDVIRTAPSTFKKEIGRFFTPFGLNLALRPEELEVQKNVEGVITAIPYQLIADTLQRLIFYLAAIESNDDAVLLFEEPEAHSYPVYVSQLARRIVESRNNQFFVVTHSPYFITEVLEEMLTNDELKPELALFVAYYEDYQTKVRQLSDEEVLNIRRDGLDVFYNMARFVPQRGES
ncbi:MAG: AAA family ATPase [Janthinobacterium lividum]